MKLSLLNGEEIKFSKKDLSHLGTLLGIIAGLSHVLGANEIISTKLANSVEGCCLVLIGYILQKPADSHPTTEELEQQLIEKKD